MFNHSNIWECYVRQVYYQLNERIIRISWYYVSQIYFIHSCEMMLLIYLVDMFTGSANQCENEQLIWSNRRVQLSWNLVNKMVHGIPNAMASYLWLFIDETKQFLSTLITFDKHSIYPCVHINWYMHISHIS